MQPKKPEGLPSARGSADVPKGRQVLPRGKVLARTGQDYDGNTGIRAGLLQRVPEAVPLRVVEGVLLAGTIQCDEEHAVVEAL